jgi:hypothetical protein
MAAPNGTVLATRTIRDAGSSSSAEDCIPMRMTGRRVEWVVGCGTGHALALGGGRGSRQRESRGRAIVRVDLLPPAHNASEVVPAGSAGLQSERLAMPTRRVVERRSPSEP